MPWASPVGGRTNRFGNRIWTRQETAKMTQQTNKLMRLAAALFSVLMLTACTSTTPTSKYDLTGVWMRAKEIQANGTEINYPDERGQSFYKVYADDGTYYFAYMRCRDGKEMLYPEGKRTWEVKDGRYIENGDMMDAVIHSADSMTVKWNGNTEIWRRLSEKERNHVEEAGHAEQIRQAPFCSKFFSYL